MNQGASKFPNAPHPSMNRGASPTSSDPAAGAGAGAGAGAAAASQPKPIRFVTNNDGPYAKRRRINTACLTCRRKKTRCSGERPNCAKCMQNKHLCEGYGDERNPTESKHHPRKPPPTVRSLSTNALSLNTDQPLDPQLTRPQRLSTASLPSASTASLPSASTASLSSGSTGSSRLPKPDANHGNSVLSLSTRNRMPYFRYFGPTAIMPGFKQMVVKVRGNRHGSGPTTSDQHSVEFSPLQRSSVSSPHVSETHTPMDIPVYDNSAMSPSPLITQLCKLFFVHLGCCFPFLQRDRFMRDLEEKQVDAILVDAVCAIAARFSTNPIFTGNNHHHRAGDDEPSNIQPSEYGQAFAQRAKSAIPDAFPCPSVAVVQAALLLAYDEFGASRDSGLWMYLGIAIRMAQDLGMQTLEGLKYEGRNGPTPKTVKMDPSDGDKANRPRNPREHQIKSTMPEQHEHHIHSTYSEEQEQRDVERERLDTFWCIFFLDRVISSGTGRPVTLRDQEIEISFPSLDEVDPGSKWPLPFPALIRIIHLYGSVTDLLNGVRNAMDITEDFQTQLNTLENQLTDIYQNLSPKLHFNAVNFQQYVKIGQGTNFLLLHCWFHTLIVLLHQPTILKTFSENPQSRSSNSRELSMSSAKTVADILAFTELIDAKAGMCNPFTSQPIYITACAFLKETAIHSASSQPQTQPPTPDPKDEYVRKHTAKELVEDLDTGKMAGSASGERLGHVQDREQKQAAKHTLLASAANQNYQRCYRALQSLESHWAGVKYILTVLDQKAKGVGDPQLYTLEEMESALEVPRPEPSFTSPGWRRKLSWGTYLTAQSSDVDMAKMPTMIRKGSIATIPGSPMANPSQAIGWSLTGTMNSPSTNVAVMYTSESNNTREVKPVSSIPPPASVQPSIASLISDPPNKFGSQYQMVSTSKFSHSNHTSMLPPPQDQVFTTVTHHDPALVSDADLLLNLHSPYSATSPRTSLQSPTSYVRTTFVSHNQPSHQQHIQPQQDYSQMYASYPTPSDHTFGDMVIDTQDIDMSVLGADMIPWDLEYLPHDLLYFEDETFESGKMDG